MALQLSFPALSGQMGDRQFYMTVMTLQMVSRFFSPTPADIPAEMRAQRALNERRVPEIVQYLIENEADWVFGSLTVSFDGESRYVPPAPADRGTGAATSDSAEGILHLDPDTDFLIVDGQHRLAAIQRAIVENPLLKAQQIGVMLIPYESLDRNQQIFSDLNRTVQKTSRSLDILYDHSDPLNGLVKSVAARVSLFKNRVEKNATSLALRSPKFVTLSSLYDACKQLLGGSAAIDGLKDEDAADAAEELCVEYWTTLSQLIEPWRNILDGDLKPSEARIEYIVAHSVAFYALGLAGARVLGIKTPQDWSRKHDMTVLKALADVDWRRANPEWQGVAMLGHSVVTRHQTRQALARLIAHIADPAQFEAPPRILGDE